MTVQLSSLRVSPEMDASKYSAGAQQKIAADKAMAASSQEVAQAIMASDAKISAGGDVLARLSRQYVEGYATQQRFAAGLSQLNRGLETGKVSMESAERILVGMNQRLGLTANATELVAKGQTQLAAAVSNANRQIEQQSRLASRSPANQNVVSAGASRAASFNVGQQIQDIAVSSYLGMPVSSIAMAQGPQLASAIQMGGGIAALKEGLVSLFSPTTAIAIGLTAATAAAVQFFTTGKDGAKTLTDLTEEHNKALKETEQAYKRVENAARSTSSPSQLVAVFQSQHAIEALNLLFERETALCTLYPQLLIDRELPGLFSPDPNNIQYFVQARDAALGLENVLLDLMKGIESGAPNLIKFNNELAAMGQTPGASSELKERVEEILAFTRALGDAQAAIRAYEQNFGPGGLLRGGSDFNRRDMQSYEQWRIEENGRLAQSRRQRDAELNGMGARSPSELAAAARAREEAIVNGSESGNERRMRIETAGILAKARAEQQLTEAYEGRIRSLDQSLASQQLELDLIGKTTGEQAALRFEFERTQQLKEEAARNGIAVDQKEIELIKQKAAEYGKFADEIARANLNRDLQFEYQQAFRSPLEQQIASRLRGTGLGMDSPEAGQMREIQRINDLRAGVKGFFDDFQAGLLRGDSFGKSLGNAILNALNKALDKIIESGVNALVNAIAGGQGGSSGGGLLNLLFGGGGAASSFGTKTGFADMLGIGAANDNYAPGAVTRAPLAAVSSGGGVASQVWNFFAGKGLAPHQIAGIMGNVSAESAFNPMAVGDGGNAFGLFQHNDRSSSLFNFLGGKANLGSVSGQLNFAWKELQTTESRALSALMSSKDVRGATAAFAGFERPSGFSWDNPESAHNFIGRLRGAEDALSKFGNSTSSVAGTVGKLGAAGAQATKGLADAAGGLSSFGSALDKFPSAPTGGGGGGFFGWLGNLFGGGASFASMSAISPLAAAAIASGGGGLFAKGGVFDRGISDYSNSIVDRPTFFKFASGSGLMGEAGPEAIMPLRRGSDGKLGVSMHGGGGGVVVNMTVEDHAGVRVRTEQTRRDDGSVDIRAVIEQVAAESLAQRGRPLNMAMRGGFGQQPALKRR